jgi:hypothetical protein
LSLEPPRWLLLPRQGFGLFGVPVLILKMKRSAPETGPPTAPSLRANRRNEIRCFPMSCLLRQRRRVQRGCCRLAVGEDEAVAKAIATYKVG